MRRQHVVFDDGGNWHHEEVIDDDVFACFDQNFLNDVISVLPEVEAFARWFHANPSTTGVRLTSVYKEPYKASSLSFIFRDLLFVLRDYLRRGGPLDDLDAKLLEASWLDIATLFSGPRTHSTFLIVGVLLKGPIDFGPYGVLTPLSNERKTELFRHHDWDFGQCPIEEAAEATAELVLQQDASDPRRHVSIVMTAMRLMVSPRIYGRGPIITRVTDRIPVGFASQPLTDFATPLRESHEWALFLRDPIRIMGDAVLNERGTLCEALDGRALDLFRVAFHRFNQAMRRTHIEDRVIDLAIAIESTVLAGFGTELSWRANMLGTQLLKGAMPPNEARAHLDALYKARSKIVHEGAFLRDAFNAKKSETAKAMRKVSPTIEGFDDAMVTLAQKMMRAVSYRAKDCTKPSDLPRLLETELLLGQGEPKGAA